MVALRIRRPTSPVRHDAPPAGGAYQSGAHDRQHLSPVADQPRTTPAFDELPRWPPAGILRDEPYPLGQASSSLTTEAEEPMMHRTAV
jgi:hypothetical protein